MKPHLEIELKTLLSKQAYLTLRSTQFKSTTQSQLNVYYDTPERKLLEKHWMVRLRTIDEMMTTFTLKIPSTQGVLEYEVTDTELSLNDERVLKILHQQGIFDPLVKIAHSQTYRSILVDDLGEWALDHSFFGHHEDYELEYEIRKDFDLAKERFLNVLEKLDIEYKQATPKFVRALQAHQHELDELLGL